MEYVCRSPRRCLPVARDSDCLQRLRSNRRLSVSSPSAEWLDNLCNEVREHRISVEAVNWLFQLTWSVNEVKGDRRSLDSPESQASTASLKVIANAPTVRLS